MIWQSNTLNMSPNDKTYSRSSNWELGTSARAAEVIKRRRWVASIQFRQVKHQVGPDKEDRQSAARLSRLQYEAERMAKRHAEAGDPK